MQFVKKILLKAYSVTRKGAVPGKILNNYNLAKEFYRLKVTVTHLSVELFLIILGIFSAGFGLEGFLLPNGFIDGGVTGISLLVAGLTGYELPILIFCINIPFVILGFWQVSRAFALKSMIAITGLAVALTFVEFPVITSDKLLVAVFGGFFLGMGIGFAVRGGGVLDGTEVLAIYVSRNSGLTIGDVILVFNIIIFSFAAWLLSIETALYSILTYIVASKTVDFVIEGVEEYTGVTIISPRSEEIRHMITEIMGRGVTIYAGKRGYGKHAEGSGHTDIVYTVITRLEIARLKTEVDKIDPNAFIVMSPIKDTKGGMIKKRPLH